MMNFLNNLYDLIIEFIHSSSIWGPLLACLLIFLESMIPILPLFVFITITFVMYGYVLGFILSYILTSLGCFFSFYLCRTYFHSLFQKKVKKYKNFDKLMAKIDNIKLSNLVLLTAIPFTPAFLVNITSGLSKMSFKKFAVAILIAKISIVFFWGFIGTSLIESLKSPRILIIIIIMLVVTYLFSKLINKKLKIQ